MVFGSGMDVNDESEFLPWMRTTNRREGEEGRDACDCIARDA